MALRMLQGRKIRSRKVATSFLSHNVSHPSEAALAIPTQWTPESVKWHAKVAGYGQSTPVVYNSIAYVTSVQGENKDRYFLEAFSLTSGERLWEVNTRTRIGRQHAHG